MRNTILLVRHNFNSKIIITFILLLTIGSGQQTTNLQPYPQYQDPPQLLRKPLNTPLPQINIEQPGPLSPQSQTHLSSQSYNQFLQSTPTSFGLLYDLTNYESNVDTVMKKLGEYAGMECREIGEIVVTLSEEIWDMIGQAAGLNDANWIHPILPNPRTHKPHTPKLRIPLTSTSQVYFLLDHTVSLSCQQLNQRFTYWRSKAIGDVAPLVSEVVSNFGMDLRRGVFRYEEHNDYNKDVFGRTVVSRVYAIAEFNTLWVSRFYVELYNLQEQKLWELFKVREVVQTSPSCQAIAFNFIVYYFFQDFYSLVTKGNFKPHPPQSQFPNLQQTNRNQIKSQCIKQLTQILGYNPLRYITNNQNEEQQGNFHRFSSQFMSYYVYLKRRELSLRFAELRAKGHGDGNGNGDAGNGGGVLMEFENQEKLDQYEANLEKSMKNTNSKVQDNISQSQKRQDLQKIKRQINIMQLSISRTKQIKTQTQAKLQKLKQQQPQSQPQQNPNPGPNPSPNPPTPQLSPAAQQSILKQQITDHINIIVDMVIILFVLIVLMVMYLVISCGEIEDIKAEIEDVERRNERKRKREIQMQRQVQIQKRRERELEVDRRIARERRMQMELQNQRYRENPRDRYDRYNDAYVRYGNANLRGNENRYKIQRERQRGYIDRNTRYDKTPHPYNQPRSSPKANQPRQQPPSQKFKLSPNRNPSMPNNAGRHPQFMSDYINDRIRYLNRRENWRKEEEYEQEQGGEEEQEQEEGDQDEIEEDGQDWEYEEQQYEQEEQEQEQQDYQIDLQKGRQALQKYRNMQKNNSNSPQKSPTNLVTNKQTSEDANNTLQQINRNMK